LSASSFFVIEDASTASVGGFLEWQKKYCLRHLVSGLYVTLGQEHDQLDPELAVDSPQEEDKSLLMLMTRIQHDARADNGAQRANSAFVLHQTSGEQQADVTLHELKLRLGFEEVPSDRADTGETHWLHGVEDPGEDRDTNAVVLTERSSSQDTLLLYAAEKNDVMDAEYVLGLLPIVRDYISLIGKSACLAYFVNTKAFLSRQELHYEGPESDPPPLVNTRGRVFCGRAHGTARIHEQRPGLVPTATGSRVASDRRAVFRLGLAVQK
jgi:hypothetical protein